MIRDFCAKGRPSRWNDPLLFASFCPAFLYAAVCPCMYAVCYTFAYVAIESSTCVHFHPMVTAILRRSLCSRRIVVSPKKSLKLVVVRMAEVRCP